MLRIKPYLTIVLLGGLLALGAGSPGRGAAAEGNYPAPRGAVNDFASLIPPPVAAAMENLAREILQKTGTSVVVVTLKSLDDTDPELYANKLYEHWGIGKKGEDKGVLIMLALAERQVRIETGYGVEGILPDGLVGAILDEHVVPFLRQGQYDRGLLNGMAAVAQVIARDAGVTISGEYRPQAQPQRMQRRGGGIFSLLFFLFFLLALFSRRGRGMLPLLLLMGMTGRGSGFGGGGGFSGGFGGFGGGLSGGGGAGRGF